MCSIVVVSYLMQTMENYQGDLTDIVRASGGSSSIPPSQDDNEPISSSGGHWKFPSSDLMNFRLGIEEATDDFGDPFSDMRDPLLHELNLGGASSSCSSFFFNTQNSSSSKHVDDHQDQAESISVFGVAQETINLDDQMMIKRRPTPCNIFSRMLQISPNSETTKTTATLTVSPCDSPVQLQATASPMGSIINANSLSKGCIVDSTAGLQIGSPRNPGIKRRKSQAKKVVCIPAPAPANSRPSGEIVPSDLWAWRKYGQKPIKGSPYPRGYYRCSSSKGCSARKQVERSRTDPNMLVITYTSEHNHPWPTQRNALAGSTRAQPSKHNINAATQPQKTTNLNEEFKGRNKDINISSSVAGSSASVKEEMEDIDEKELDMDEGDQFSDGYPPSYKPTMPDSNLQPADQDFFADLDEIETDPLSLLLNQGFRSGDDDQAREIKALDPFSIFDCWSENSCNNNTSYGEAKRGL